MRVLPALLSIALVGYGAAAFASGLDQLSGRVWTLERVVPRPFRAQAFRSAAMLAMINEQNGKARDLAREAVWHDPANPDSAAILGSAYLLGGDGARADKAFRVAAQFGWRNLPTQSYWYGVALEAGDYAVAADRADAILRLEPKMVDTQDLLKPLETNPDARPFLVSRIRELPDWVRYEYLNIYRLEDREKVSRRVDTVSAASPLGCGPIKSFVRGLLGQDRRGDAARIWNANCPKDQVTGLIADPGFSDLERATTPFGWTVLRSGDVSVRQSEGGQGVELHNAAATTRQVLAQSVDWPAGNYRVRLKVDGDPNAAAGKFGLSISCDQRQSFPSPSAGDPVGAGQVLRSTGCAAGRLALWMKPGTAPVALHNIEIEKLD